MLQRLKRKEEWKQNILGSLSILLSTVFPYILLYCENVKDIEFIELVPLMILYILSAAILFLFSLWLMKSFTKAIVMTNVLALLLFNFELPVSCLESLSYRYYCAGFVSVLLLVGIFFLVKHVSDEFWIELNGMLFVALSVLIIVNFYGASREICAKVKANQEKFVIEEEIKIPDVDALTAPNFYYFIFDEYGGLENLERYADYDNSQYLKTLEDRGFQVSNTSFNRESKWTSTIVPNLLNLDYLVNDHMGEEKRLQYMICPRLYVLMKELGYDINTCSEVSFIDKMESKRCFQGLQFYKEIPGYYVLERGVFIHLLHLVLPKERLSSIDRGVVLINAIEWFLDSVDSISKDKNPQFSLVYFCAPHPDFLFQEDGSVMPEERQDSCSQQDYISYLRWINSQIDRMLDCILEKDPQAVIVIQSDHGFRYLHWNRKPENTEDMRLNQNILNCVYYKGEELNIEGLSGINTLRTVLNTEFGLDFDMIEYQPEEKEE